MLRGELGDAAFFKAIRSYFTGATGTSVLTSDFVAAVERSSGSELGWFFDQWLDRVGCPVLQVSVEQRGIVIRQTQSGEPYRFRLKLAWTDARGGSRVELVKVRDRETTVRAAGARDVELDPGAELLYRAAR
jgi:aminopeptidase N